MLAESILTILSIIGFVGALPQIWGASWKDIWMYYHYGTVPWSVVQDAYMKVFEHLKQRSFFPTVIIGIGRGGMIATGLLGSKLITERLIADMVQDDLAITPNIKVGIINSIVYIKREREWSVPDSAVVLVDKIELSDPDINISEGDKVLLVVAQSFTGSSLNKALNIILSKGIPRKDIITATLFLYKNRNIRYEHTPDIFGKIISINKTMPWKNTDISTDRF